VNGHRRHLLGVGLVALVLLGLATLLDGRLPDEDADPGADAFLRTAAVGDRVDLRTMDVRVDAVRTTAALLRFGVEMRSPGVWVVVEYTVVATDENTSVAYAELRAGDRVWSLDGRSSNDCSAGPPGVQVGCVAYFEVPRDAVPDLRVWLARDVVELRYDAVADIDLGLTAANAEPGGSARPLEVPDTWLGERP
jgi:hypothetical protein